MFAIKVENLTKSYKIRHQKGVSRYKTIQESIVKIPQALFGKKTTTEMFLALNDVSFEIKPGERLGIIGRNGAGKSTLLKVLSRITEPSSGKVSINGRVASLLEVGTGFHPELTGRENVFMNGAILGMSRLEIKKKFDEIIDFAEVEQFIDTPVKRYSSGMYVRLAFAVAAHLEPEILLIDEVLAVGDAQFQKKCLGKMEDVSKGQGRTVLFVSHNMAAVESLCTSGIQLSQGRNVSFSNDVPLLVKQYLHKDSNLDKNIEWTNENCVIDQNEYMKPLRFYLSDSNNCTIKFAINRADDIMVCIELDIQAENPAFCIGYALYNENGTLLYWTYQTDSEQNDWPVLKAGNRYVLRSKLPNNFLNEGRYRLELIGGLHYQKWFYEPGKSDIVLNFEIGGSLSSSPYWMAKRPGIIAPTIKWQIY